MKIILFTILTHLIAVAFGFFIFLSLTKVRDSCAEKENPGETKRGGGKIRRKVEFVGEATQEEIEEISTPGKLRNFLGKFKKVVKEEEEGEEE